MIRDFLCPDWADLGKCKLLYHTRYPYFYTIFMKLFWVHLLFSSQKCTQVIILNNMKEYKRNLFFMISSSKAFVTKGSITWHIKKSKQNCKFIEVKMHFDGWPWLAKCNLSKITLKHFKWYCYQLVSCQIILMTNLSVISNCQTFKYIFVSKKRKINKLIKTKYTAQY